MSIVREGLARECRRRRVIFGAAEVAARPRSPAPRFWRFASRFRRASPVNPMEALKNGR